MGILNKKIKASSLTEVLVATVLILLVVGIAFTTLSNVLQNSVSKQKQLIETRISELEYLYKNNKLKLPFNEEIDSWNLSIYAKSNFIFFEAKNTITKKNVLKKISPNEME